MTGHARLRSFPCPPPHLWTHCTPPPPPTLPILLTGAGDRERGEDPQTGSPSARRPAVRGDRLANQLLPRARVRAQWRFGGPPPSAPIARRGRGSQVTTNPSLPPSLLLSSTHSHPIERFLTPSHTIPHHLSHLAPSHTIPPHRMSSHSILSCTIPSQSAHFGVPPSRCLTCQWS